MRTFHRSSLIFVATALLLVGGGSAWAQDASPSPSPSPSASASPSPSPSSQASTEATPSPSPTTSPDPTPTPDAAPQADVSELSVSVSPSGNLAQIGDRFRYRITVTNQGSGELTDVVVRHWVAAELTVVGVPILDGVEGINLGRLGEQEDITWFLGDMSPGQTWVLPWFAKVDKSGDFAAAGTIDLTASGETRSLRAENIYVGMARGLRVTDAGLGSITREVVEERRVTVPAEGLGAPGAPGTLPLTGSTSTLPLVAFALALIGGGSLLVMSGARRLKVAIVVTALALTGCVGDGASEQAADPNQTAEVKGQVIERDEEGTEGETATEDQSDDTDAETAGSDEDGTEEPAQDGSDGADAPSDDVGSSDPIVSAPTTFEVVREVRTVEVPVEELPVVTVGKVAGDNEVGMDWSQTDGLRSASSSILATPDQVLSLRTALSAEGKRITVEVTLRNESDDRRVAVDGRILHQVFGLSGGAETLSSDDISVVLAPGAESVETFVYSLPTGSYTLRSSFTP